MKIVVNDVKSGKSFQREIEKGKEGQIVAKKIGESFEGGLIGLDGYTLKITGGTDRAGFPMAPHLPGVRRSTYFLSQGMAGVRKLPKGKRVKKQIRGSTVTAEVEQVNAAIDQYGSKSLSDLGVVFKEEKKSEDKPAETKPAEKPAEQPVKEAKGEKPKPEAKVKKSGEQPTKEEKSAEKPKEKPVEAEKPKEEAKASKNEAKSESKAEEKPVDEKKE
ncbi:MAG: S6e family ribosomal protein [Candidatus Micrarchaeia archaeon]